MLIASEAAKRRAEQIRIHVQQDMWTAIVLEQDLPFQLVRYYAPALDIHVSVPMEWIVEDKHPVYDVSLFVTLAMTHSRNKSKSVG